MNFFKKSSFIRGLVAFVFLLGIFTPLQSQAAAAKISYVALGDSLAAGQLPFKTEDGKATFDKGYSGIFSEYLEEQGLLGSYTNKFAKSGYTTENVLLDIQANKEVEGQKIQDALKTADIVTITAGANDLLHEADINVEKGTITIEPQVALKTVLKLQLNLVNTIKAIQTLNPKAEVYVSGYYNAFPYLDEEQETQILKLIGMLNSGIKTSAENNNAIFVPMIGIFDTDPKAFLPNPLDIHPSILGYNVMAQSFITAFNSQPKTVEFDDVSENHFAYKEIQLLVQQKVMTSLSEKAFGPGQAITRADAAQALFNILPFDKSIPEDPGFTDVPTSHPAYMAIAKLTAAGVFTKAEKFNPDASLTRAQMAKIFTLAFKLKAIQSSTFTDVTGSSWAKTYVDAMLSAKVTTGYPDNTFKPNLETSRAHFAVFLVRAAGLNK
ncbi:S-layer homology domain-containing protein [Neobacillus sp. D3-1R]|uniref:S-layer homology domain-containing protein n=1 Tax=Neobacillus sp. D3-1R TaxID=3445778 RepID=UPI003FA017A8